MKIFSAGQIKAWDEYTIQHEPIASIDLMERASIGCVAWLKKNFNRSQKIILFCGPGNNGGDGLAIARLMLAQGFTVDIYVLQSDFFSTDFTVNLQRLRSISRPVNYIIQESDIPPISKDVIVIDALFGYGLNRPLQELAGMLVARINASGAVIISIDMPSGLFAHKTSGNNMIVRATCTLTFQVMKLAFLLPENADFTGDVEIIDIGLHESFYHNTPGEFELVSSHFIQSIYQPRKKFSHKGTFGNTALIAGSYGMMGAAVLAARACLRSGVGKLTCHIPETGYEILQSSVPEAMCVTDSGNRFHSKLALVARYDACAIGPGWGMEPGASVIKSIFNKKPRRLIIDADALNILSENKALYPQIPPDAIITPHPKEFERLFGASPDHFSRLQLALEKARELGIYIILKGRYSFIATPGGKGYFNSTGNPGMATAGSGDVLTGMLLGLSGQYADAGHVALMGAYLHGLAGDLAAAAKTEEAMVAGDIIDFLPAAFQTIKNGQIRYL
ncbi:MAG: NAD(P)H-hydrate dehydratase [Chitinophagaceae bacterium]|nr:NAD(P)H-hydrate dehydratase [Chitinophagaceae bacterium]